MPKLSLFGKTAPRRVIVKEYGRDTFLGLLNQLLTLFVLGPLGIEGAAELQARVAEPMEKDAAEMLRHGYRIAATQEYERPALAASAT